MAELLRMPEVATGSTEAIVAGWLIEPGQAFDQGEAIVSIETDKAQVEVEAEHAATMLRHLAREGGTVEVGAPLALIGEPAEQTADLDALLVGLGAEPPAPAPATVSSPAVPAKPGDPDPDAPVLPRPAPATSDPAPAGRRFISPIARRLLREANASVDDVVGTGPHGRVLRRDVEEYLRTRSAATAPGAPTSPAPVPSAPTPPVTDVARPPGEWTDVPHTRLRRAIASRLTMSKQTIPHFAVRRTARIDALIALRAQINAVSPVRVSMNDLLVRAVAVAHREVPEANVVWTEDATRRFTQVDVGVAIASPRGLVTPVLRAVETTTASGIAARVKELVAAAVDGRLAQADLEGGTVTVTNLGMYGVEEFTAIINPPQSTILAVGAGRREPVVTGAGADEQVRIESVLTLVASFDHRVIDGALGAQWMAALVAVIENPMRLLV